MKVFPLCPECGAEYGDPLDRRYHAEPTACPVCGPRLRLVDAQGAVLDEDALGGALRLLRGGQVVALKGLGGFHLAVDARDAAAVERLRQRKGRALKPLAVMVRDLAEARRHAEVGAAEEELLTSAAAPIVLLLKREDPRSEFALYRGASEGGEQGELRRSHPGAAGGREDQQITLFASCGGSAMQGDLAPGVAPGNPYVGLMLPYTPLHHLLLAELPALVMTSGNLSEEPIAIENVEARRRLATLADAFLEHDREILVACDDSVVAVTARGPLVLRRSRGYVPDPVRLPVDAGRVLALGGQLKNTFCLALGREAYLGPHVGDLDNLESYEQLQRALRHLTRLLRIEPEAVVHDLHPDYATTRFAVELGLPSLAVQHHHAHVAAVALEHGEAGPLLGLALDGTGYGTDGTIWGGELLLLPELGHFERVGHLRGFTLPGGEACIRAPRRTALALCRDWLGPEAAGRAGALLALPEEEERALAAMLERRVGLVPTTSCGRLFDALAALCGLGARVTYEGQPAMELEHLAARAGDEAGRYPMEVHREATSQLGPLVLDPGPALAAALEELARFEERPRVAARFHAGLAAGLAELCARAAREAGVRRVALGGGCFQNRRLLAALTAELERRDLEPLLARRVPPNDGGLALGQIAVYASREGR